MIAFKRTFLSFLWEHLVNAVKGALLFGGLAIVIQLFWWAFYPYQIATIQEPVAVMNENDEVEPGGVIQLTVVVNKVTATPAQRVDLALICNNGDVYVPTRVASGFNLPEGEFIRTRLFTIPEQTPIGATCIFQFDTFYEPNPIRTIHLTWQSEPITVRSN